VAGLFLTYLLARRSGHETLPLRNPFTGQEVVGQSGRYRFDEGAPQLRIATQSMAACARHGFKPDSENPFAHEVIPQNPDEDVKASIPSARLS
jgi:hypothetical protein